MGGIKQYKCMVILREFPYNTALCWVGSIMTPVVVVACCLLLVANVGFSTVSGPVHDLKDKPPRLVGRFCRRA